MNMLSNLYAKTDNAGSSKMPGQGKGKLFLFAPLAISILHCVLVFYPFEVDCVIAQDRQGWGRSAGQVLPVLDRKLKTMSGVIELMFIVKVASLDAAVLLTMWKVKL